jgi:hypothetical protein
MHTSVELLLVVVCSSLLWGRMVNMSMESITNVECVICGSYFDFQKTKLLQMTTLVCALIPSCC